MNENPPSRAAKIAKEIGQKMATLAEQEKVAPTTPIYPSSSQEKDTPEMRQKRRIAVEKLRTFLD